MWTREIWEKIVYKYSETIEKNSLLFKKVYNFHGQIIWEFLGLRMGNFQGVVFIWTQTYMAIFKSALVHL